MTAQTSFDFDAPRKARREATAEILAKIKKLLRLGQSSNPHEAALAMRRAFELAEMCGVQIEDLDLDDEGNRLAHEYFHCGERLSFLRLRVLQVIAHFFEVEVCIDTPRVIFVGRESAIAIAGYIYEFLTWAGAAELRGFCAGELKARRKVNEAKRKNFVAGFMYGIAKQLRAGHAVRSLDVSRTAIVAAEAARRVDYLAKLGPTESRQTPALQARNGSALMKGFARGQATNIAQPLNGSAGRLRLK